MGICKKCGRDIRIVNKFFGLCQECNNERLHGSKYGSNVIYPLTTRKPLRSKQNGLKSKMSDKTVGKIKADEDFYEEVFRESNHRCEECGAQLNDQFRDDNGRVMCRWRYSHILPKSTYPEFRHNILNCNSLCILCHQMWENGDKESMRIFDKNQKRIEIMKNQNK